MPMRPTSKILNEFEYLTSGEFAKAIGVHVITLKRWADKKRFLPKKINTKGHKFYSLKQVKDGIKFKQRHARSKM